MTYDLLVLRAVLRLGRSTIPATLPALLRLTGGTAGKLRASVRRLRDAGLLEIRSGSPESRRPESRRDEPGRSEGERQAAVLTMAGLVLAASVSTLPRSTARAKRLPRRLVPRTGLSRAA